MIKYLVVIGVIAFVYYVFIKKKPKKTTNDKNTTTNDMVQCARCDVYCELDEAILSHGHYNCSEECLRG